MTAAVSCLYAVESSCIDLGYSSPGSHPRRGRAELQPSKLLQGFVPSARESGASCIGPRAQVSSKVPEVFDDFDAVADLIPPSFANPVFRHWGAINVAAFGGGHFGSHGRGLLVGEVDGSGQDRQHELSFSNNEDVVC